MPPPPTQTHTGISIFVRTVIDIVHFPVPYHNHHNPKLNFNQFPTLKPSPYVQTGWGHWEDQPAKSF